ncbi:hypothetical protein [Sphingomonas sp. Leaf231]|uniref:hypothetical protein n=1 Tax=Sphingomonas sp. Leaf231 TaxID=1736301 RepID=UPI000AF49F67|nr:hypothetical protein [Sphingomonas sp. Leaf231]
MICSFAEPEREGWTLIRREIDWNDPDVEHAREILLGTLLESFRENRAATDLEADIINEAEGLSDYILSQDSRTFCILAVSFMEDALKRRFAEKWSITSSADTDLYFGSNGPLSTFAQRLTVAKGIEWLTDVDLKQASILRKIRNHFAHNHRNHDIDRDPLVGLAESLNPLDKMLYNDRMDIYKEAYDAASKATVLRIRIYCTSLAIVSSMLNRSKLIAANLPAGMTDGTGFSSLTEVQQRFIDLTIRHSFRSLGITRTSSRTQVS